MEEPHPRNPRAQLQRDGDVAIHSELSHNHVVKLHSTSEDGDKLYLVQVGVHMGCSHKSQGPSRFASV